MSYLQSKQWPKMKALMEVAFLRSSDVKALMELVEEIAKTSAIDDTSSWKTFSFLFQRVAELAKLKPDDNPSQDLAEKASLHRIALDYLTEGQFEAAVQVASALLSPELNEFLYKYMMQNGEARLAKVCWANLKECGGPRRPKPSGEPALLFAPATLRALQGFTKGFEGTKVTA